MSDRRLDCLFVHAGSRPIYQALADEYSAVEVPTWALLLAGSVRAAGFGADLIDQDAERLTNGDVVDEIHDCNPRLVCFVVYGSEPNQSTVRMASAAPLAKLLRERYPEYKTCFVGAHPSALPLETLALPGVDFVCLNEGAYALRKLLTTELGRPPVLAVPGVVWKGCPDTTPAPIVSQDRMDVDLPGHAFDLIYLKRYRTHFWHSQYGALPRSPAAAIYTSLGCPYTCFAGDTVVNTVYGDIPIKELSEKYESVGVFTFDFDKGMPKVASAINIRRTGTDKKLVRVKFRDGSYLDCTPDHKFLKFKWGNQSVGYRRWEVEAQNLKKGDHVQAMRLEIDKKTGRTSVGCGRKAVSRYRIVAEWMLERKLTPSELVHHKDHNCTNDSPENLEVLSSVKEHLKRHPEISERMRTDNPTKNGITEEWQEKIRAKITGLTRSEESRERYRLAAIRREASLSPEEKAARAVKMNKTKLERGIIRATKDKPQNHVVESVEELPGLHDVYCMEVPGVGWFFANKVLVHNCSFCCIQAPFKSGGPGRGNAFRYWSAKHTLKEIETLVNLGISNLRISDEMFFLKPGHYEPILKGIVERGWGDSLNLWAYARVDSVRPDKLELFRKAGVRWLCLGIESGNQTVRREAAKGSYEDVDIRQIVRECSEAGIEIIGNYIFGLEGDTWETMRQTQDLALELNTLMYNCYPAMALPGSQLHREAKKSGRLKNDSWASYGFLSYECIPLGTEALSPADVLKFRDEAFREYWGRPGFLAALESRFGTAARNNVESMLKIRLRRKLLGDPPPEQP